MPKRNTLMMCFPSHVVASTETVNKSVGKGKKVNTTKGDKKIQQPEQEVINQLLLLLLYLRRKYVEKNFLKKVKICDTWRKSMIHSQFSLINHYILLLVIGRIQSLITFAVVLRSYLCLPL